MHIQKSSYKPHTMIIMVGRLYCSIERLKYWHVYSQNFLWTSYEYSHTVGIYSYYRLLKITACVFNNLHTNFLPWVGSREALSFNWALKILACVFTKLLVNFLFSFLCSWCFFFYRSLKLLHVYSKIFLETSYHDY